jgi:hypothetical protein
MQTASLLLPILWGVAVFTGLLGNHFASLTDAKFLSMRGLGLAVLTLGAAILISKTMVSLPMSAGLATYALAGYAGGVLSFYFRKLYVRTK